MASLSTGKVNGLAIDPETESVYWTDSNNKIEKVCFDCNFKCQDHLKAISRKQGKPLLEVGKA